MRPKKAVSSKNAVRSKKNAARSKKAVRTKKVARSTRKWSASVSRHSDALDLQTGVFKLRSARQIARSLKKSAEASRRRKASPFQSAMSMLNFEIHRAGKSLPPARRRKLDQAKGELRKAFGRASGQPH